MAVSDIIHDAVKNALVKDGWTITDDPYTIDFAEVKLFADLGAERPIGFAREGRKLVIEAKSFRLPSPMNDPKTAVGQYLIYRAYLQRVAPGTELWLAISQAIYNEFFRKKAIEYIVDHYDVRLIVVDLEREEIRAWID